MKTLTQQATFLGAETDVWPALIEAAEELGLEVHEDVDWDDMDAERDRWGRSVDGWVELPEPWGLEDALVRRLASFLGAPVDRVRVQASAPLAAASASYKLDVVSAVRVMPRGGKQDLDLPALREGVSIDERGSRGIKDEEHLYEALDEFMSEVVWDQLAAVRVLDAPDRMFILRRPEGWRPPDGFTLALANDELRLYEAVSVEVDGEARELDPEALAWLAWSAEQSGNLDRELPAPDLSRWTQRLLRRFDLDAPPPATHAVWAEWTDQWQRLTRKDRGQRSESRRKVPAWKLETAGLWELDAQELAALRGVAELGRRGPHGALAVDCLDALEEAEAAVLMLR